METNQHQPLTISSPPPLSSPSPLVLDSLSLYRLYGLSCIKDHYVCCIELGNYSTCLTSLKILGEGDDGCMGPSLNNIFGLYSSSSSISRRHSQIGGRNIVSFWVVSCRENRRHYFSDDYCNAE